MNRFVAMINQHRQLVDVFGLRRVVGRLSCVRAAMMVMPSGKSSGSHEACGWNRNCSRDPLAGAHRAVIAVRTVDMPVKGTAARAEVQLLRNGSASD